MSEKISPEEVLTAIESWTVLELSEFIKAAEERFGVSAAAPVAFAGGAAAPSEEVAEEEEQTQFDVILVSVGEKKIPVIKEVRSITSLGLKEAKALVEAAPTPVKEGLPREEAEKIAKKLEDAGASAEIK